MIALVVQPHLGEDHHLVDFFFGHRRAAGVEARSLRVLRMRPDRHDLSCGDGRLLLRRSRKSQWRCSPQQSRRWPPTPRGWCLWSALRPARRRPVPSNPVEVGSWRLNLIAPLSYLQLRVPRQGLPHRAQFLCAQRGDFWGMRPDIRKSVLNSSGPALSAPPENPSASRVFSTSSAVSQARRNCLTP